MLRQQPSFWLVSSHFLLSCLQLLISFKFYFQLGEYGYIWSPITVHQQLLTFPLPPWPPKAFRFTPLLRSRYCLQKGFFFFFLFYPKSSETIDSHACFPFMTILIKHHRACFVLGTFSQILWKIQICLRHYPQIQMFRIQRQTFSFQNEGPSLSRERESGENYLRKEETCAYRMEGHSHLLSKLQFSAVNGIKKARNHFITASVSNG